MIFFECLLISSYSSLLYLLINNMFIFGCCKHLIGYFLFIHKYYSKNDHMLLLFDMIMEGLLYQLLSPFMKKWNVLITVFFHVILENSHLKNDNSI